MATGDHLRRHRWSGETIYGSRTWSGGTIHSKIICQRWSGGTHFGGTICGMTDPRVDSKIGLFVQCTLHYTYLDVIRSYWHRHKKIEVILAYLRTVHRMAVG